MMLFTSPKPFHGHSAIIQRNAIRSWTLLHPPCQIILCGDDEGTAETAAEMGAQHIPTIACTDYGTPLVSDLFEQAQRGTTHNLVCYINADIILMGDFLQAAARVAHAHPMFLMGGQRWDVDITTPLDFSPGWEEPLRRLARQQGKLHNPSGIDYFVFPRGMISAMPPFAIGRPGWDCWLLYHVRSRNIPLIDATRSVMAIHQNHGYGHVPQGTGRDYQGPEARQNLALLPHELCFFTLNNATELLTPQGFAVPREFRHLREYPWDWLALHPYHWFTIRQIWRKFFSSTLRFGIRNVIDVVTGRQRARRGGAKGGTTK
jgi:hypothetical protein